MGASLALRNSALRYYACCQAVLARRPSFNRGHGVQPCLLDALPLVLAIMGACHDLMTPALVGMGNDLIGMCVCVKQRLLLHSILF